MLKHKTKHEEWFHEYKRELVSTKNIGKHLCAFSNRFGGVLYFGIEENDDTMCAESFPGLPSEEIPDALVKVRQGASEHCSPVPYFGVPPL